jgi:hypothetical protein
MHDRSCAIGHSRTNCDRARVSLLLSGLQFDLSISYFCAAIRVSKLAWCSQRQSERVHQLELFALCRNVSCLIAYPVRSSSARSRYWLSFFPRIFRNINNNFLLICAVYLLTVSFAARYRGCQVFDSGPFQRCFAATKFAITGQFDSC